MLSKENIQQIQTLYLQGVLKKDIAEIVHCSAATVGKYTKNLLVEKDNMIGKKFGKLVVLKRAEKRPELSSRCLRYLCQCECGATIEANGGALRAGTIKSCGCSRKQINCKDLSGLKFGKLSPIEIIGSNQNRRAIWKCKCDCGNIINVSSDLLLQNSVKSCGCMKASLGEQKVGDILTDMGVDFITEYRIPECRNCKPLPFDFAIFEQEKLICLIEYQGEIHYHSTGGWNTEQRLQENRKRDAIKEEYCMSHNIKLITIPYTDYDNLDKEYLKRRIYG